MKYTQRKSNDYLEVEFERYLGPVQKWRLLLKFRSIRTYPGNVLVIRLHPDNVSSPVILSPFKVTKYLYCDVGPLSDLSMFVSIVLPLYCHISLIHIHSCIHSMHTDIIHACLHCQSYFNCTKSVICNVSDSEMLPITCISSGRSHQNSRLSMPFHFPSVFPSMVITPVKVIDGISFHVLVVTLIKVIDGISFHVLVVTPVKVIDGISFRVLVITPVKVIDGISFRVLVITPVKVIDGIFFRVLVITPVKVIDGIPSVCWSLSQ